SRESLMPLGIYLQKENLISLDSLLNFRSFKSNADADLAYPLAGLFNQFMMERIGHQKYFALYRKSGGSYQSLVALPVDSVKGMILRAVSISSWEKLTQEFNDFLKSYKSNYYVALPGNTGSGEQVVSSKSVVIRINGEWLEFEFLSENGEVPKGNLLFGKDEQFQSAVSAMFVEQYGNEKAFEGYRFGVRFDVNEAGLYDYAANNLLAKYIEAVEPSQDYYNPQNHKISFRIKKNLTNSVLPSETDYKLLNY
ncbi:MAG: hypothetical protein ACREBV_08300, partial [Candidatus Zixiibacteriota bacterium]